MQKGKRAQGCARRVMGTFNQGCTRRVARAGLCAQGVKCKKVSAHKVARRVMGTCNQVLSAKR